MYSQSVSQKKEKKNTLIYFNTNYRTEMKPIPINIDYCLLQFDAIQFFLGVRLQGGGESQPNFNFFKETPKFFNEIVKLISQIA